MFITMVASLALIATAQPRAVSPSDQPAPARELSSALPETLLAALAALAAPAELDNAQERAAASHLDSARRAMKNGEFDLARREFRAAATLTRAAGKLPLEAVLGLAEALYAQSYDREAATTLEALAAEASLRGDSNVEALALADAFWLNTEAGQRVTARKQRDRLRSLMKDTVLSPAVQRAVRARVG